MDIDKILADRELDKLVAEKVMDWVVIETDDCNGEDNYWLSKDGQNVYTSEFHIWSGLPNYSTDISAAWEVVDRLGKHAGNFSCCDGWFKLLYAESADHYENNCTLGEVEELEDGTDPEPWSCHFHLSVFACEHCEHDDLPKEGKFCAHGPTAALAICRAALKMMSNKE